MNEAEFAALKAQRAQKAEQAVATATQRLEKALAEYQVEVERHEERGDGFFPGAYLKARKEAVLARKYFESKVSALATARAERDAATLGLEAAS